MDRVLVIGLGVSGKSAAFFLKKKGYSVTGTDQNLKVLQDLRDQGYSTVHENDLKEFNFDLAVVSPGIPSDHPILAALKRKGIDTIGEIELACRYTNRPFIGITGSNGKTTVSMLVGHVLNHSGMPAKVLGNAGIPLTSEIDEGKDIIVCELSSFQLETMQSQVIDAAVILNITPNHLDRHTNMEEYAASKARIAACLKPGGKLFLGGTVLNDFPNLFEKSKKNIEMIRLPDYKRFSTHDQENEAAALALCAEFGVNERQFKNAKESFQKPSHRIEYVRTLKGISYYNDSKGTNLEPVARAVESMPCRVVLIAGGKDKGCSYVSWIARFGTKVKAIIAIGEAKEKIKAELSGVYPVELESTLERAVLRATSLAEEGECVLLSPGCSSYDMFNNYEERGERFKAIVRGLSEV